MNQKLMDYMDLHKFYKIIQMMIINRIIEKREEIKRENIIFKEEL